MSHNDVLLQANIFSRAGYLQTTDDGHGLGHELGNFGNLCTPVMMTCPLLSSANVIAMYVWYEISPYLSQFLEGTTTCILVILYSHEWTSQVT